MSICVKDLILPKFIEPTFYVNFHKIQRATKKDSSLDKIEKTNNLLCWKIENKNLSSMGKNDIGILFDGEFYIVQWLFDLRTKNQVLKESLVYYWKGQSAPKGYTPLPPELEEQCPVERIVQWSEPAIFFHGFQKNIICFSGKDHEFVFVAPHLLLARGELPEETHFYEVPCKKVSLRSRTSFLLIVPEKKSFLYWHGSQTSIEQRQKVVSLCQPHHYLSKWQKNWSNFLIYEQEEGQEDNLFLESVQGDQSDFLHMKLLNDFSPKLFYLNTITGTFLATEIEYPLRTRSEVATFPFLQSHLYTAIQPAIFLLDNNTEIWLWEGMKTVNCDNKDFDEELKQAKELQNHYAEEKRKIIGKTITCFHIYAYKEPPEFKNVFPFWVDLSLVI